MHLEWWLPIKPVSYRYRTSPNHNARTAVSVKELYLRVMFITADFLITLTLLIGAQLILGFVVPLTSSPVASTLHKHHLADRRIAARCLSRSGYCRALLWGSADDVTDHLHLCCSRTPIDHLSAILKPAHLLQTYLRGFWSCLTGFACL